MSNQKIYLGKIPQLYFLQNRRTRKEESLHAPLPEVDHSKPSWHARASKIPMKCRDFFLDAQNMQLIVEFFSIASQVCRLANSSMSQAIPYLNIVSSPFYLYHAVSMAKNRFELMIQACRVSKIAEIFFWAGRGVDAIGSTLSDVVKPLGSGIQLLGFDHIPAIGVLFSFVIPIVLMVCGTIGGVTETWALIRAGKTLHQFNEKVHGNEKTLEGLAELLVYLQGPQPAQTMEGEEVDKKVHAQFELDKRRFNDTHFSSDARREAVQAKIYARLHQVRSMKERVLSDEVKGTVSLIFKDFEQAKASYKGMQAAVKLIEEIEELYGLLLLNEEGSEFRWINDTKRLYEKFLSLLTEERYTPVWGDNQALRDMLLMDVNNGLEALQGLELDGKEIIDTVRSEIHRLICTHAISILLGVMAFTAGILYLISADYQMIATYLSLASNIVAVSSILFNKFVSQERFLMIDRHLLSLKDKLDLKISTLHLDQTSMIGEAGI